MQNFWEDVPDGEVSNGYGAVKYLSVCSGIEAATQAWHTLGFEPVAFSEIEPFPSRVLAHHYPRVPNYGDMTKFKEWPDANVDILVGGTPCQSFSIAGLRKGLDDPRGNLMLTYLAIAAKYRPAWLVWENVPGVLSSNGGKDFGTFLAGLGECGYGFAYRVLDAQYCRTDGYPYAVPQRRRRVFVVGHLGSWQRAAAVLFDSESLRGNPPSRREAGKAIARSVAVGVAERSEVGHCLRSSASKADKHESTTYIADITQPVAPTLDAHYGDKMGLDNQHINAGGGCSSVSKTLITKTRMDAETETLIPTIGGGFDVAYPINTQIAMRHEALGEGTGMGIGADGDAAYTLQAAHSHAVAFKIRGGCEGSGKGYLGSEETTFTLSTTHDQNLFIQQDESLYNVGIRQGEHNASTQKTYSGDLLSRVQKQIGAEAFAKWGLGILDSLQEKEILRQALHGKEFRQASFSRSWVVCCALGSPFSCSEGALQSLRETCGEGCSSQGWESLKQLSGELGAYLSGLSQPGAQAERFMQDLWESDEGIGILRKTLSAIQEIRRSSTEQGKPIHADMQVRRLTVGECTFLQGFPRNFLPQVPGYSDSAAYKALGNSMAVNVMQLIGQRIQMVSEIPQDKEIAS